METLRYYLEPNEPGYGSSLAIQVPLELDEYNRGTMYGAVFKHARRKYNRGIRFRADDDSVTYSIDPKIIGEARQLERTLGLRLAAELINNMYFTVNARNPQQLDPDVFLHMTVRPRDGKHKVTATVAWAGPGKMTAETLKEFTLPEMVAAQRNLPQPYGDTVEAEHMVHALFNPHDGVILSAGGIGETIRTHNFDPQQKQLALGGETNSLDSALILAIGAVSIAEHARLIRND